MTPVRPSAPPIPTPVNGAGSAKSAAQRAFFEAALGRASGSAAPAPAAETAPTPHVTRVQEAPAQQPTKILRPGSLLNILV